MRRLAPLVLLLASLAVTAGVLELALRVLPIDASSHHSIAGFTVYDPVLGWKLAPSRSLVFRGAHFAVRVTHDAEGLRDDHVDHARAPGRRRVLVLGDSVVWCWGVEHAECFTELVERALGDTDVVNAGVPGYSTAQELLFYENQGRRYRPDVVVLVVSPNDADDNVDRRGPRFRLAGERLVYDPAPPPRRKSAAQEWLQEHSRLFTWLDYVGTVLRRAARSTVAENPPAAPGPMAAEAPAPGPRPTPAAWALTEALFDRFRRDVATDGAELVVVLEMMSERLRAWQRGYWAAHGVPCLELAPALLAAEARGEQVRLEGDPHLAPAGQIVLAAELGRVLRGLPGFGRIR
ncbi:MAG: SGNH/GDSL hydrolase family protein [Deltaproteobacteria bacterium]|nr:SGNH/GDSL hydrolase family protein [Deltaproteobacteria bacterium]